MDFVLSKKEQQFLRGNIRVLFSLELKPLMETLQLSLANFDLEGICWLDLESKDLIIIQKLKDRGQSLNNDKTIIDILNRNQTQEIVSEKQYKNNQVFFCYQQDSQVFVYDEMKKDLNERIKEIKEKYDCSVFIMFKQLEEKINKAQLMSQTQEKTMNQQDFQQLLFQLQMDYKVNYEILEDSQDEQRFLKNLFLLYSRTFSQGLNTAFDSKGKLQNNVSLILGVEDQEQHWYINLLWAIPKVSEDKAVAITAAYKSIRLLLEAYERIENIEDKKAMLENITVKNPRSADRKLGRKSSEKVYMFFFCGDHNKIIS